MRHIQHFKSPIVTLASANLTFVSSYALLGPHALFLGGFSASETQLIVLGMSLFSASQIGASWFLALLRNGLENSKQLLVFLRVVAILLLIPATPLSIFFSLVSFGFSHAIFYKLSRRSIGEMVTLNIQNANQGYLFFSLTTNLAFITATSIGSALIHQGRMQIGILFSGILFICSIWLLKKTERLRQSTSQECQENTHLVSSLRAPAFSYTTKHNLMELVYS